MNILPRIRRFLARCIASFRFSRVVFKRLALDEKMLLLILNDPLCLTRISNNTSLTHRVTQLAKLLPSKVKPLPERQPEKQEVLQDSTKQYKIDTITDISLGINWGPKSFPIGCHTLYLRRGMGQLAERWLRRLPSDAWVVILFDSECDEEAQRFASQFRQVRSIIPFSVEGYDDINENETYQQLNAFHTLDAIVVPLAVEHKRIEFIPGNTMPNIGPEYEFFKKLWFLGFRQYAMLSFCGLRQIEIPFILDCFVNKHKGQRCFVVGNGPSLNQLNMKLLKNEITLGSNRCYLGFAEWDFHFNYWACVDRLQIEQYCLEYQDNLPNNIIKFVPFEYMPMLQFPNLCPINFDYDGRPPYKFSGSPDIVYLGFTVTYTLVQIAVIMGCNPIYLIGVDHRYNLNSKTMQNRTFGEKQAKIWIAEDSTKPTHFTDKYTTGSSPKLFVTPKPEKAEVCFDLARQWTQKRDINIINATPDTGLKVFDRVDYNSLF